MQENQDQLESLKKLISEWGISLPILAKKAGMATSTFKNKYYRSGGKYDFNKEEIHHMAMRFKRLAGELSCIARELDGE